MNLFKLVLNSFKYYLKANLLIAAGIIVTTAVITGALLVGDSMQYSLLQSVNYRLGNIDHSITAGERLFTKDLAQKIESETNYKTSQALMTSASGMIIGGEYQLENIQLWGVDNKFNNAFGSNFHFDSLENNEIVISQNVSKRLLLDTGDKVMMRIRKINTSPSNTPFVSDELFISKLFEVKAIESDKGFGRLNLSQMQSAPFNAFVNYSTLNEILELENRANTILISADDKDAVSKIENAMQSSFSLRDINFELDKLNNKEVFELKSDRVFIDSLTASKIENAYPHSEKILSYFANQIKLNDSLIPYSFVASSNNLNLKKNEIILNQWAADDLNAEVGDTVNLRYYIIGPLKTLKEDSSNFIVKKIVAIEGYFADKKLSPNIPGLSDAGSCSNWDTDVPVDLEIIRDKDEVYWKKYKSTPKAFINFEVAQELWANRFGDLTSIRFDTKSKSKNDFEKELLKNINIQDYAFEVKNVKQSGYQAAKGGVDFGQLFISLSFFIILSGILLSIMLFKLNVNKRTNQIQLFHYLGFSKNKILKIIISEQLLSAFIGAALGVVFAIAYNELIFNALNKLWFDIVRTNVLETRISANVLLTGFIISFIVSILSQVFVILPKIKSSKDRNSQDKTLFGKLFSLKSQKYLLIILSIIFVLIIAYQLIANSTQNTAMFFIAGILFLLILIISSSYVFRIIERKSYKSLNLNTLSLKNIIRNRSRSLTVIIILSLGSFAIVSTGLNKKDLFSSSKAKSSGSGGFVYYAETTIPVLKDLNKAGVKKEFSLKNTDTILQMRYAYDDNASCLNLNKVSNPKILSVKTDYLKNRFSFAKIEDESISNPWEILNKDYGEYIPAIADQTVILWGLGKKIGDTINYTNAYGEDIVIKLVGGLQASVFQGGILISEEQFLKNFPYNDGSNIMLVSGSFDKKDSIKEELQRAFESYGLIIEYSPERLAKFKSVENTYLNIFLVLGAIGLLIGIIGFAILSAISIEERQSETALYRAIGYSKGRIFKIYFREYLLLLGVGYFGGLAAAFLAVSPSLISPYTENSIGFVAIISLAVILNGIFWIGFSIYRQLKGVVEN